MARVIESYCLLSQSVFRSVPNPCELQKLDVLSFEQKMLRPFQD
jgi:hypothetical protein